MTHFDPTTPFAGLSVLVTGNLPNLSRPEAQAAVVRLGGKAVGSVSGSTGLVVIGDGAGVSKMVKIRRHDTLVLDGVAFEALLEDPTSHPAVTAAVTTGQLGVPCSVWEAGDDDPEPEENRRDPRDKVPFSERHLVGQATGPRGDGARGTEYRMWCLKCGEKWIGSKGPYSINEPCPNDPLRTEGDT